MSARTNTARCSREADGTMRAPVLRPSWSTVTTVEQGLSRQAQAGSRRTRWLDILGLGLGAILLRIPSLLAPTNLGYDDGGYGAAAIAMREGYEPFRDIFSSQGPLFLLVGTSPISPGSDAPPRRAFRLGLAGAVTSVAVYRKA